MFGLVLPCRGFRYLAGCPVRVQVFYCFARPSGDSGCLSSLAIAGMERGWFARVGSFHPVDSQYFFLSSDMGPKLVWILRQVRNFCRLRRASNNGYFTCRGYSWKLASHVT